jgi:hypothetical protein
VLDKERTDWPFLFTTAIALVKTYRVGVGTLTYLLRTPPALLYTSIPLPANKASTHLVSHSDQHARHTY